MKKRGLLRVLTLALAFNAMAVPVLAQRHRAEPAPPPDRHAVLSIDGNTGKVLYESGAAKRLHPASTTKVMTAYLTFRALEEGKLTLDQELPISADAAKQPSSNMGLIQDVPVKQTVMKNGHKVTVTHYEKRQVLDKITVETALKALLCPSANDAAVILAEAVGGTKEDFVRMMNDEAKTLGMHDTNYANPNGLPDNRQITTAEDLVKLERAVFRDYSDYTKYFTVPSFSFNNRVFHNTNHLMLGVYPNIALSKTGWIATSGFNLVIAARRGDELVLSAIFGASSPQARSQEMTHILDYSFQKEKNPKAQYAYGHGAQGNAERFVELPPKEVPAPPALVNTTNVLPPIQVIIPTLPPPPDNLPAPKENIAPPVVSLPPKPGFGGSPS